MRLTAFASVVLAAALLAPPAHAIQVRSALLSSLGVELSSPQSTWPMNVSANTLKEALDAYKGPYKDDIAAFYSLSDFRRIWVSEGHFLPKAKALIERFSNAQYDGLEPKDYLKAAFFSLGANGADEKAQAEAEVQLSASAVAFTRHLSSGRIDPSRVGVSAKPDVMSVRHILNDMTNMADVNEQFKKYEPPHETYRLLRAALVKTLDDKKQVIEKTYIPSGPVLSEGMKDERVPMLRARFAMNAYSDAPPVMDSGTRQGAAQFSGTKWLESHRHA